MPYNLRGRNWNFPTVSRGRDTRGLVPRGHHGNRGSLTFSLPNKLAESFLAKHGNGQPHMHLKLERRGHDILLLPSKGTEFGRKFSPGNTSGRDYRVFFDPGSYGWIADIEPFGSTETTAILTNEGCLVTMPPVDKRIPLPETEYKPRKTPVHWQRKPLGEEQQPYVKHDETPRAFEGVASSQPQDTLYLVNVPADKDGKFHMMLRFLKLEAIKE